MSFPNCDMVCASFLLSITLHYVLYSFQSLLFWFHLTHGPFARSYITCAYLSCNLDPLDVIPPTVL
jgi:hypothetical protein